MVCAVKKLAGTGDFIGPKVAYSTNKCYFCVFIECIFGVFRLAGTDDRLVGPSEENKERKSAVFDRAKK